MDEFDLNECSVFRTTNNPALVNEIRYIKAIKFLYLLFYIDENRKGKSMIKEATKTRLKNIKKQKKQNDCYGITSKAFKVSLKSVDEILEKIPKIIEKYSENNNKKVFVQEISFFSHAGWDGPISYYTPVKICPVLPPPKGKEPRQMALCGWEQIKIKWAENARCVFYGCNTGNSYDSDGIKKDGINFAENISKLPNFKNVEVWGQPSFSFPSFYPDYRVTSLARSISASYQEGKSLFEGGGWNSGRHTYQVADHGDQGMKPISLKVNRDHLTPEQLKNSGYPKALPMNCYKNGVLILSSHQGVFNDHR